jgi:hypothetical protein
VNPPNVVLAGTLPLVNGPKVPVAVVVVLHVSTPVADRTYTARHRRSVGEGRHGPDAEHNASGQQ